MKDNPGGIRWQDGSPAYNDSLLNPFGRKGARKEVDNLLGKEVEKWCTCNLGEETYSFHVPPFKHCEICKGEIDNDHYHCGACLKLSQIG